MLFSHFQSDIEEYVIQLEKVVPNYLLRLSQQSPSSPNSPVIKDKTTSDSPIASSHSDYGSSISPTETALANALNDSFIMVN